MRSIADLCTTYGSGMMRLTPWQNLIFSDVPNDSLPALQTALKEAGLTHEASHAIGGLIACTGSRGCKFAAADTKGDALAIGQWLDSRLTLPQPVNIHLTGCNHSCAQHYVGDIGMQAVRVERDGQSVDGYNIVLGGGTGSESAIGRSVKNGVASTEAPALIEQILLHWTQQRSPEETFHQFTSRLSASELEALC
jgi:ferredoxin-nitrite reductase